MRTATLTWSVMALVTLANIASAQPAADPRAELEGFGKELEAQFRRLEARLRAAPRDTFDPRALMETVGRDPEAMRAWVRDRTDLLPYRGALRGSRGVVMGRAGNSLDRALLLAELLSAAGHEVRLANTTLEPPQASALLATIGAKRKHHPTLDARAEADAKPSRERVTKHAQQILQALSADATAAAADPSLAEKLSDHWWVQRRDASGQWVDVDPAGLAPAPKAGRTVPYDPVRAELPLEPADCHEVVFRLVVEAYKQDKLATEVVFEKSLRPAELFDRSLTLYHYSDAEVVGDGSEAVPDDVATKRLKDAVIAETDYFPILIVGGEPTASYSFDTAGDVNKEPDVDSRGRLNAMSRLTGGMAGGLAGAGGGNKKKPDRLTAEWIEYEVRVPGEPQPHVARRMVFDLIGPAARAKGLTEPPAFTDEGRLRRGLALLGTTQVVLQPCHVPGAFVVEQMGRQHLQSREAWRSLTRGEFETIHDVVEKLSRTGGAPDFAMFVATSRFPVAPEGGASTFVDRPNVVQFRTWGEPLADGTVQFPQGIDLAFTSTAAMPGATARDAFAARLTQGVADTLAENLGTSAETVENTIPLFERAGSTAGPVVARRAEDLSPLGLSPDVAARAASDIAAGSVLVVAKLDTGRAGWWRVDPRTGQTVGVMDNGYNATAEYKMTKGRPPPGPERARYIQQMMRNNKDLKFNDLSREAYEKIARGAVPEAEWAEVLSLTGRGPKQTIDVATQLLRGMKGKFTP